MGQPRTQLAIKAIQKSVQGVKLANADSIGIVIPADDRLATKGVAAVIANGLSEGLSGQEASQTCVQNFLTDYYATPETWAVKSSAQKVLISLNRWLCGLGGALLGPKTAYASTFSAIVFKARTGYLFHVGDARIYRLRGEVLEQLTKDHVSMLSSSKSCLSRAMGVGDNLEFDFRQVDLDVGDKFLLATDGIHAYLSTEQITQILLASDRSDVCNRLIELALRQGADDNLSCQLLEVQGLDAHGETEFYAQEMQLPFPPILKVDDQFDGYRVEVKLFSNEYAHYYVFIDACDKNRYLAKCPRREFRHDESFIRAFVMAAWAARQIKNRFVCSIVEPARSKQSLYQLFEFSEARSLEQWLHHNPQPDIHVVVSMMSGLVRGVTAFHRIEALYQAISPESILVGEDHQPRLIEYGAAQFSGLEEHRYAASIKQVVKPTYYAAPELLLGFPLGHYSDLFSLGVLCYHMLTGKYPYGAAYLTCKTQRQYYALEYVPSYHHNPMIPVWLDGAIRQAVQIHAQHRYAYLSEFIHDLKNPNPRHLSAKHKPPLLERYPERFWQGMSVCLLCLSIFLCYKLLSD